MKRPLQRGPKRAIVEITPAGRAALRHAAAHPPSILDGRGASHRLNLRLTQKARDYLKQHEGQQHDAAS